MGKKGTLSETEIGQILRRYSAVTVVGLLHEIASCETSKLDFNALVKNTTTGIRCAREYQALWRHIAYRAELEDSYEEDAEPLEDDSDLEFELEPVPSVSPEAAAEAAAWVKADMQRIGIAVAPKRKADALSKPKMKDVDSTPASGNQAPASSGLSASVSEVNAKGGAAITASVPVWDASTTSPTGTSNQVSSATPESPSAINLKAALGQSERKKRKLWSTEEDQELIAAVEKCGEGNWTNILKGDFTHDRTAAQLSQRWALIRKRREVQAAAAASRVTPGSSSGVAVDVQQGANQRATSGVGGNVAQNGGTSVTSSVPQLATPVVPGVASAPVTPPVPVAGTTTGPCTSAQVKIEGQHVTGSTSNSPGGVGITIAPNGAPAPSVSVEGSVLKTGSQVARPPGGSSVRSGTVATHRQAQAVGTARSTAGSSTAVAALTTEQVRSGVAKTVGSGVGAGRLIAPGALVMSAAAAQAASVGGSEMWQATSLPPAAAQSSVQGKYGPRGNLAPSGGRINVLTKQHVTGPDPGVQAAAVAAGARIAPASAAASLLKAAQSGNVVHIGPGGVPITKSGLQQAGIGHGTTVGSRGSSGGAIVHYIRTGSGAPPPSIQGMMRPAQQPKTQPGKSLGVNNVVSKPQSSPAPSSGPTQTVTPPTSQSK